MNNYTLDEIIPNLKIEGGTFAEELPEQILISKYLTGNEKVLEIGSNIGRSSLVIAYILNKNNNDNFVTMECNNKAFAQLEYNKNINGLKFYSENSALSDRKLIQKDPSIYTTHYLLGEAAWPSDFLPNGYLWVNTISYKDLISKYGIVFDTLVLDCEGAFYYILQDMPEILEPIKLVIMENDYINKKHKKLVDSVLESKGFILEYNEAGGFGPCYDNFYQVWRKNNE